MEAYQVDDADAVYEDFGQKVDLTARIREVLAAYPDGSSILKELCGTPNPEVSLPAVGFC